MRVIGIILASVAVLAATGQAYLTWTYINEHTNYEDLIGKKVERACTLSLRLWKDEDACEGYLKNTKNLSLLLTGKDEMLREQQELADLRLRSQPLLGERFPTEEQKLKEARRPGGENSGRDSDPPTRTVYEI